MADLASAFYELAQWMRLGAGSRAKADELAGEDLPGARPAAVPKDEDGQAEGQFDDIEIEGLVERERLVKAPLFNVTDGSGQTQEDIGKIIAKALGIKVDYVRRLPANQLIWTTRKLNRSSVLVLLNAVLGYHECSGEGRFSWLQSDSCLPKLNTDPYCLIDEHDRSRRSSRREAYRGRPVSTTARVSKGPSFEAHLTNCFTAQPWLEMLSASKTPISNTPLSPILPPQILRKNRCHLDGSKMNRLIPAWRPKYPKITVDEVKECIVVWKKDGIWPDVKPKKK